MKKINGVGLTKDGIDLYSKDDFLGMHKAGRLAAQILDEIGEFVYPGQSTSEIDKIIEEKVNQLGARSATIGYKGYEHASCISINHVVCHGIPSDKKLKDGDRIAFKYIDNPNGALEDIAGILSENHRVLGMMPHPERHTENVHGCQDGYPFFEGLFQSN